MVRLIFLLLLCTSAIAQPKFEVKELSGVVKGFEPGWGFAYEEIVMEISGEEHLLSFSPYYGKLILSKIRVGDQITVKARVYPIDSKLTEAQRKIFKRFKSRDDVLAIKKGDEWLEFPPVEVDRITPSRKLFYDLTVKDEYKLNGRTIGLIFDDGIVAYKWYQTKNEIKKGDVVSFFGQRFQNHDGFEYPVPNVKEVYWFNEVLKETGTIKSLLFKQNYVCIGMVVKAKGKEIKVSFPSNYAQRVQQFIGEDQKVTIYFDTYELKGLLLDPPELRAVIYNRDTLMINQTGFYGGADIKHEHKPATLEGKITQVNRKENGRILNFIVGNDCYIEIDPTIERQLGSYIQRGQLMQVQGDERIKAEGEVYSKDYRIITPRKFVIEGKTFLLNQIP